jgi:dienelactone hydrolase
MTCPSTLPKDPLRGLLSCLLPCLLPCLLWAGSGACRAQPVPMADFSTGPGQGVYSYASTTPASLADLMQRSRPRPAINVQAELRLPPGQAPATRWPAVVLVHGSGGVYPELVSFWARRFNEQGIAAMVIDVFGPRGVKSTAEDQGQVPFAADTADAFAALGMLASHPGIDPQRVAVMGFSRGGITALRSAVRRVIEGSAPPGLRFAAHVAAYSGGCAGALAVAPKPGVFDAAPVLFVHGDADDYTYLSDCRRYADRLAAAGTSTELVVLPGARHKFDADDQRRIELRWVSKTRQGCPLEFDVTTLSTRHVATGEAVPQAQVAAQLRELCADKGATIEGDTRSREAAAQAVLAFLNRVLRP